MGLVDGFDSLELEPLSVCGGPGAGGLDLGRRSRLSTFARDGERRPLHDSRWDSWCPPFPFTPTSIAPGDESFTSGFTVERLCALALRSHLPARVLVAAPPSFGSIHSWSSGLSRNYL